MSGRHRKIYGVCDVARLEKYNLIMKSQIVRNLRLFVLFYPDAFLFPRCRNEILNITTYAALFTGHFTAAGTILRFVSESVTGTWHEVSFEVTLKVLNCT